MVSVEEFQQLSVGVAPPVHCHNLPVPGLMSGKLQACMIK